MAPELNDDQARRDGQMPNVNRLLSADEDSLDGCCRLHSTQPT